MPSPVQGHLASSSKLYFLETMFGDLREKSWRLSQPDLPSHKGLLEIISNRLETLPELIHPLGEGWAEGGARWLQNKGMK